MSSEKGAMNLIVTEQALKDVGKLSLVLDGIEQKIVKISKDARTMSGSFKSVDTKLKLNSEIDALIKRIDKLEKEKKDWIATNNKLDNSLKKTKKGIKDIGDETQKSGKYIGDMTVRVKSFFKTLVLFDLARRLVNGFWESLKKGFDSLKVLDSVRLQFQYIVGDMREVAETQAFLVRISNAYGAELLSLSNRYIKFRAATKQSNMSARETQKIFESVSKAAGVLGLKTHELNGIYLALEQMISKGKVTTEELRRQLGERLPGAMGIMADAVGVTVEELDKMLKKGQVLSKDALPKFAVALEKAYSIENVKRVDTLQAATVRLDNSFTVMVQNMEGGESRISRVLIKLYEIATVLTEVLGEFFLTQKQMEDVARGFGKSKGLAEASKIYDELKAKSKDFNKSIGEQMSFSAQEIGRMKVELDGLKTKLLNVPIDNLDPTKRIRAERNLIEMIKLKNEQLGFEEGILLGLSDITKEASENEDALNESRRKSIGILDAHMIKTDAYVYNIEQMIKQTKAFQQANSDPKLIEPLTRRLEQLNGLLKVVKGEFDMTKAAQDGLKEGTSDVADEMEEWAKILESLLKTQKEYVDFIKNQEIKELKALQQTLQAVGDIMWGLADIGDALMERNIVRLEKESDAMNARYDLEAELVERSIGDQEAKDERLRQVEKARSIEQARLDKKIAKEKTKQFKINQVAALADIGINVALAIVRARLEALKLGPIAGDIWFAKQASLIYIGGGLAAAAVLAQPVPKFAEGYLEGRYQGPAIINDGGQTEVLERRGGKFEMSSQKNKRVQMNYGDKVHKSFESFSKTASGNKMLDNIKNAAVMSSLASERFLLDTINTRKAFDDSFRDNLRDDIVRSLSNITINNNSDGVARAIERALKDHDFKSKFL